MNLTLYVSLIWIPDFIEKFALKNTRKIVVILSRRTSIFRTTFLYFNITARDLQKLKDDPGYMLLYSYLKKKRSLILKEVRNYKI